MRRITIDPVTRLEGHGKIEIFLNDDGDVENVYFQVPELRGFEKFCVGRPAEEMPRIVSRICGVCPEAHHLCSTKALDNLYGVQPPSAAVKLRELFYCAHQVHSHIAHFYVLAAPDFVLGPHAEPAIRNILGLIKRVGAEVGSEVIKHRSYAQRVQEIIGGKATHPVCGLPGGVSKSISEEERREIEALARSCVEFGELSARLFDNLVLRKEEYVDLITGDVYSSPTYYMGLVDDRNRMSFYDGTVRVVDPEGEEVVRFPARDYLRHIAEAVEPWTYLKFPYLREVGWRGLVGGKGSGVYCVGPLARLNVAEGVSTPRAQEEYEKMYSTLGGGPIHAVLANHWARIVEILNAAERMLELSRDEEITSDEVRTVPTGTPREGFAVVEAPRGTLFHHYETDEEGIITRVNIVVATTHNNAPICMSIKQAAAALIRGGEVSEGLLNMVEMAFRAYDPCFGCATHSLPGDMPLEVRIYDFSGRLRETLRR